MSFPNLPLFFIANLMKYWLSNYDLIKLDTSLTVNKYRKQHKKIYELPFFKIENEWNVTHKNMLWVINNNIKLTNLFLKYHNSIIIKYISENMIESVRIDSSLGELSLSKILKYLKNISELTLDNKNLNLSDKLLIEISKQCTKLESISLKSCNFLTIKSLTSIFKNCPLLKKLDLSGCNIRNNYLSVITNFSRGLDYLNLNGCPFLDDVCLINFVKNFPIKNFKYKYNININYYTYESIIESSVIQGTFNFIESVDFSPFHFYDFQILANRLPNLNEIEIRHYFDKTEKLIEFIKNYPNLKVLNLEGSKKLTDDDLISIINNCPNLFELNISGCSKLTNKILETIFNCKQLKKINFGSLDQSI